MDKIKLAGGKIKVLQAVLQQAEATRIIDSAQQQAILELCEEKSQLNQAAILLTIGSALVGAGILSFIAANWDVMSSTIRIAIIFAGYLAFFSGGHFVMAKYYRTGLSLIYIAMAIFGAGIFLIGQIFNYADEANTAFLIWGAGILPAAFYYKDKIIYHFAILLMLVNICIGFGNNAFPWTGILAALLPFACYRACSFKSVSMFFLNINLLCVFGDITAYFTDYEIIGYAAFLTVGSAIMLAGKFNKNLPSIIKYQGFLIFACSALFMTDADAWSYVLPSAYSTGTATGISLICATAYFASLLFLIRSFNITAPVFICILILRYYFDTLYDFLPKSMFFLIGGMILLLFGFFIESLRKKRKGGGSSENIA